MIVVIADDFTGAAEIGGVALRNGFRTEILIDHAQDIQDADVLVFATNTRAEEAENARKIVRNVLNQILPLKPHFIYKKIDSVMRGNVAAELIEQLEVTQHKRALLIPANPAFKRIIKDGIYYLNNTPLNLSQFTSGKKNATKASHVLELIGHEGRDITSVISRGEKMPDEGLIIGNTIDEQDLKYWAENIDHNMVIAGGACFFNAILHTITKTNTSVNDDSPTLGSPRLYICGSAYASSKAAVKQASMNGRPVFFMPPGLLTTLNCEPAMADGWLNKIIKGIDYHGAAIIAVDEVEGPLNDKTPSIIKNTIASITKKIMDRKQIKELLIEGGATASAVMEALDYRHLLPIQELAPGVIRMAVKSQPGMFVTMKPGSYSWPGSLQY